MLNGNKTSCILFALCVDDFGVKYDRPEDFQHLIDTLKENVKRTTNIK